jgi:asparaginyl-tRNA synthetase
MGFMDYRRTYIKDLFQEKPGTEVSAFGWVKTRRDSKGVTFVQLNDGSCFKDIQIVIDAGTLPEEELKRVTTGASVRFDGTIVDSPAAGQAVELKATGLHVFGEADPTKYPMQKKGATMEFLREISHLRTRGNTFGAMFRQRLRGRGRDVCCHDAFGSRSARNSCPPERIRLRQRFLWQAELFNGFRSA